MRMFLNEMYGIVIDRGGKLFSIIFQEVVCHSRFRPYAPFSGVRDERVMRGVPSITSVLLHRKLLTPLQGY